MWSLHKSFAILKDRGGLQTASGDVISVCKAAEAHFRMYYLQYQKIYKKNVMNALIAKCYTNLPSTIFPSTDHMLEQGILGDHRCQLLKLILKQYFITRICHYSESEQKN